MKRRSFLAGRTSGTEFALQARAQSLTAPAAERQAERDAFIVSSSVRMRPDVLVEERPVAPFAVVPFGVAPSGIPYDEPLPRDVMVRLAALSRQVDAIRKEQPEESGASPRLDRVIAGLDSLIQRIGDETARHECD